MLIKFSDICRNYDKKITGVVHCGAHLCEELEDYYSNGVKNTIWIEADPNTFKKSCEILEEFSKTHSDFEYLISNDLLYDIDGLEVNFNVANNNQSSSILELGIHKIHAPEVYYVGSIKMETSTLDRLFFDEFPLSYDYDHDFGLYNFLNLDLQGVELKVLYGAVSLLKQIDYVYTEINTHEVYVGCGKLDELDEFLNKYGFKRRDTVLNERKWGDALYVKD